jgi:trk system potassium uptake protein TrkA
VIDSFELSENYNIIEAKVPQQYVGKTIEEIDFRGRYNLNLLTIIKMMESTNLFGKAYKKPQVMGVTKPGTRLEGEDILVLFGSPMNIQSCLNPQK